MKSRLFTAILVLSYLLINAQPNPKADSIDKYLSIRTDMGKFSGAVLIAQGDNVWLKKGYGYANVEDKIPFTTETNFEIASISKMFTSMAVLKLRDAGKLKPEDPICNYIDNCPAAWKEIMVKNLMQHTSGIHDYEETFDFGSDKYFAIMTKPGASKMIVDSMKQLPLDFKPGEKFHYSNTGYIVLSYVVQKAAGMPFEKYITENILKPAGMLETGVLGTAQKPKKLAYGYTFGELGWNKTLSGYPLTSGHLKRLQQLALTPPEGDADLYSNVSDLYKWSLLMDGSKFIPEPLAKEIYAPGGGGFYGYGWMTDSVFNMRRLSHSGGLPGYTSQFIKFPNSKTTIIILCNLDRARMEHIVHDIEAIVFDRPYDMPVRGNLAALTTEQLTRLEGIYKTKNGTVLTIKNSPDYLTAELKGRFTAGLIPISPVSFYFPLADGRALFDIDASGKPKQVNLRFDGEDHIFYAATAAN